jgi:hypothetical protein
MKATLMYGAGDVRIADAPDPAIHAPTDAIVRVVRAAICGSDLHPYRSMPATSQGRQMGHEVLGIIEDAGGAVVLFMEKPNLTHVVSMGVYCMQPEVLGYIPPGVPFGFDDLMSCMLARGLPVHIFPHNGFWLDIGRVEDFQKAQDLAGEDMPPAFETAPIRGELPAAALVPKAVA